MAKLTKYQLDALTKEVTKQVNDEIDIHNKIILNEKSDEIKEFKDRLKNNKIIIKYKLLCKKKRLYDKIHEDIKQLKQELYNLDNNYPYCYPDREDEILEEYKNKLAQNKFLFPIISSNEIQQEIILSDLTSSNNLNLQELIDSIKSKFIG